MHLHILFHFILMLPCVNLPDGSLLSNPVIMSLIYSLKHLRISNVGQLQMPSVDSYNILI